MSPELIDPQRFGFENSRPTKSSDCYALGMVIYETISGHLPFHQHTDLTVFVKVLEGVRPPRGVGFAGSLWGMLELCWVPQPNARPKIEDVLQYLENVSRPLEPPPRGGGVGEGGWDSTNDSSGRFSHLISSATSRGLSMFRSPVSFSFAFAHHQRFTKPATGKCGLSLLYPMVCFPPATQAPLEDLHTYPQLDGWGHLLSHPFPMSHILGFLIRLFFLPNPVCPNPSRRHLRGSLMLCHRCRFLLHSNGPSLRIPTFWIEPTLMTLSIFFPHPTRLL